MENNPRSSAAFASEIQRESDLIPMLERTVRERLPKAWRVSTDLSPRATGWGADAVLTVAGPDGTRASCLVEARLSLEPRMIASSLKRINQASLDLPPNAGQRGAPLFVSRFVSRGVKDRLADEGCNYADATGNLRLELPAPAVFLFSEGAKTNPWREETRGVRSLRGRKTARIVRALCDLAPPFGVRELADVASVAPGTVSRTAELLDQEALIERNGTGRIVRVSRSELVRRWSLDFRFQKQNEIVRYLEPRELTVVLDKLRDHGTDYAITGSYAANAVAPYADPRLLVVYAEDVPALEAALSLRRAERSSNVWLASAPDDLPLTRTWIKDGLRYAALSQVGCDLMDMPGRSAEEAEALLRHADV